MPSLKASRALNAVVFVLAISMIYRTAEAKRVGFPSLTELAKQADQIAVGTVQSVDKPTGHNVIAASAVWKGPKAKNIDSVECRGERVGTAVIVILRPRRPLRKSGDASLCAAFADTPANRAVLTKLFGTPTPIDP